MDITKDTFRKNLVELVKGFIANSDRYGDDPQICVIPADGRLSIMTADEFHESPPAHSAWRQPMPATIRLHAIPISIRHGVL